jgi:DNA-directed RNA polymerase subunit E'/Rpb7
MNTQKFDKYKDNVIYSDCLITRTIQLSITSIDKDIFKTISDKIVEEYEGRCVVEGFIKPSSCVVMTYSSGLIKSNYIIYEVVFNCKICFPVEGMIIRCVANNITKAGIRAEIANVKPSPAVVFITRDHHYNVESFSNIKEGDTFEASVIGQRFELNDKFVSIIAKLKESRPLKETRSHEFKTPMIIDSEEIKSAKTKRPKSKKSKDEIKKSKPKPTLQLDDDDDVIVPKKTEDLLQSDDVIVSKKTEYPNPTIQFNESDEEPYEEEMMVLVPK